MDGNFVSMKTVLNFLNTKNMAVSCYDLPQVHKKSIDKHPEKWYNITIVKERN